MKFVAVIQYLQDDAKVSQIRPLHRQYLAELKDQGKIAASGPFADNYGALIIYETETREEAESLIENDPFRKNGVFLKYDLRPWTVVMVNRDHFA